MHLFCKLLELSKISESHVNLFNVFIVGIYIFQINLPELSLVKYILHVTCKPESSQSYLKFRKDSNILITNLTVFAKL